MKNLKHKLVNRSTNLNRINMMPISSFSSDRLHCIITLPGAGSRQLQAPETGVRRVGGTVGCEGPQRNEDSPGEFQEVHLYSSVTVIETMRNNPYFMQEKSSLPL